MDTDLQSIQEARRLAEAAHLAWTRFEEFSEDQVDRILAAVAKAGAAHARELAEMAVEETGFGNVADKTAKNLFASDTLYQAIRPLRTIGIVREDAEKRIFEVASPVGVIAGIVPSTNPTSTALYKVLIALKGRNGIVLSPHPAAVRSISATVRLAAEAAGSAGAPAGLVSSMETPTLEGTQQLMSHPKIALILATGGPGLVRAAYSSGKPAFGVGPGNVPAYIERTAWVAKAVSDILTGKCFDNGTLCSSEQSIICDEVIREEVLTQLAVQGAHVCSDAERGRLEKVIQTPRRTLDTRIVGQSASRIAEMAGIEVPAGTRALVGLANGVGPDHPLSMEKLSPILGFYTVGGWEEGCRRSIEILGFGGMGHTLALHSEDPSIVRQFALRKPAFRICVNTPAALGAVGYTTNLFPAMTLGCGASGGNVTSDNISPLHLINLKRVAYCVRDYVPPNLSGPFSDRPAPEASKPVVAAVSKADGRQRIADIVDGWLGRRPAPSSTRRSDRSDAGPGGPEGRSGLRPMLGSYSELPPTSPAREEPPADPVDFVCEDDVRSALGRDRRIVVSSRTIITPSARELGDRERVFVTVD
jgi:acetaldehyde dehydrogenase (acetylating)